MKEGELHIPDWKCSWNTIYSTGQSIRYCKLKKMSPISSKSLYYLHLNSNIQLQWVTVQLQSDTFHAIFSNRKPINGLHHVTISMMTKRRLVVTSINRVKYRKCCHFSFKIIYTSLTWECVEGQCWPKKIRVNVGIRSLTTPFNMASSFLC